MHAKAKKAKVKVSGKLGAVEKAMAALAEIEAKTAENLANGLQADGKETKKAKKLKKQAEKAATSASWETPPPSEEGTEKEQEESPAVPEVNGKHKDARQPNGETPVLESPEPRKALEVKQKVKKEKAEVEAGKEETAAPAISAPPPEALEVEQKPKKEKEEVEALEKETTAPATRAPPPKAKKGTAPKRTVEKGVFASFAGLADAKYSRDSRPAPVAPKPKVPARVATMEEIARAMGQPPLRSAQWNAPSVNENVDDDDDELEDEEQEDEDEFNDEDAELLDSLENDEDSKVSFAKRARRGDRMLKDFDIETGNFDGVALGLRGVAMRLGGTQVLQDATWLVKPKQRLALVGANGCGKTTQLKIILGELTPDEGEVKISRAKAKISLLSQGFVEELDLENTVRDELLSSVPQEAEVLKEIDHIQQTVEGVEDPDEKERLLTRLTDLQVPAEELRVYELPDRIRAIAKEVGFLKEDLDRKVGTFSGGWKVKIGLAKIFMQAPDALLLDEPTNHLDLESVEWIERLLKRQKLPIVVVSHDREFMDQVCNRVVETMEGMTYSYKGSYSDFVMRRQERMAIWLKRWRAQAKKVDMIVKYIKEHKVNPTMTQPVARRRVELEKMQTADSWIETPPRNPNGIKFSFPTLNLSKKPARSKQDVVCELDGVTHGYGEGSDSVLFKDVNLELMKGDMIGIVGRNGSGKSTLLRLMMGHEEPNGGTVKKIDPAVVQYFSQHEADLLPSNKTILDTALDSNQLGMETTELYELLTKFRFGGDRKFRKLEVLSGGEKARVAIVCMMLQYSEVLVFDEPTNHLDVVMKETLEFAVREFPGTVVVVSHDRWFLSQTCRTIVELTNSGINKYDGDYHYYMRQNAKVRDKVENHYQEDSEGIQPIQDDSQTLKKKNRGFIKQNKFKRQKQARKELEAEAARSASR